MEGKTDKVSASIRKHHEDRGKESYMEVLKSLRDAVFLIPLTEHRMIMPGKEEDSGKKKGNQKRPDILRTAKGQLLFPIFSSEDEIPEDYYGRFEWVRLPFWQSLLCMAAFPTVKDMIINPFSNNFVLQKEVLDYVTKNMVPQKFQKGVPVRLRHPGEKEKDLKECALEFLKTEPQAKRAWFEIMTIDGEESYVFAVETEGDSSAEFFGRMHAALLSVPSELPLKYMEYTALRDYLEALQCEEFYTAS